MVDGSDSNLVQLGHPPVHGDSSASLDLRGGRLGHHLRNEDGQPSQTFFIAARLTYPDLLEIRQLAKKNVNRRFTGNMRERPVKLALQAKRDKAKMHSCTLEYRVCNLGADNPQCLNATSYAADPAVTAVN